MRFDGFQTTRYIQEKEHSYYAIESSMIFYREII